VAENVRVEIVTDERSGSVSSSGVSRKGAPPAEDVAKYLPKGFQGITKDNQMEMSARKEALRLQREVADFQKMSSPENSSSAAGKAAGMSMKGAAILGTIAAGIFGLVRQSKIAGTALGAVGSIMGAMMDVALMPFMPLIAAGIQKLAGGVAALQRFMLREQMILEEGGVAGVVDDIGAMLTEGTIFEPLFVDRDAITKWFDDKEMLAPLMGMMGEVATTTRGTQAHEDAVAASRAETDRLADSGEMTGKELRDFMNLYGAQGVEPEFPQGPMVTFGKWFWGTLMADSPLTDADAQQKEDYGIFNQIANIGGWKSSGMTDQQIADMKEVMDPKNRPVDIQDNVGAILRSSLSTDAELINVLAWFRDRYKGMGTDMPPEFKEFLFNAGKSQGDIIDIAEQAGYSFDEVSGLAQQASEALTGADARAAAFLRHATDNSDTMYTTALTEVGTTALSITTAGIDAIWETQRLATASNGSAGDTGGTAVIKIIHEGGGGDTLEDDRAIQTEKEIIVNEDQWGGGGGGGWWR
jgi:hypothetical protein